jgi:uncharacterized protein (DUF1684 family)
MGSGPGDVSTPALVSALAFVASLALGCSTPPPDDVGYVKQVEAGRAARNAAYSDPSREPNIARDRQSDYLPLAYYPIDLQYHVPAVLKPATTREIVEIPTSTGPIRRMERIGRLEFTVNGQQLGLSAFAESGSRTLFVPFRDETSRSETYPGGRYLDLAPTPTGLYEVDFNLAYNPYCYFNSSFECPYPPPENRLPVAIRAGEKLSEKKRAELNPAD